MSNMTELSSNKLTKIELDVVQAHLYEVTQDEKYLSDELKDIFVF